MRQFSGQDWIIAPLFEGAATNLARRIASSKLIVSQDLEFIIGVCIHECASKDLFTDVEIKDEVLKAASGVFDTNSQG